MYPGIYVPPIPRKKAVRSLDQEYLHKRQKVLENFLEYLHKSTTLSITTYLSDFLSISDD